MRPVFAEPEGCASHQRVQTFSHERRDWPGTGDRSMSLLWERNRRRSVRDGARITERQYGRVSSDRAVRRVPPSVCDDRSELRTVLARSLAAAAALALLGASAAPVKVPAPNVPLHAVYTVETNKLGQVVRIVSANASNDARFNTAMRGNALQAFIRRPDGTAVAGVYKLTYDYSPQTKDVRSSPTTTHLRPKTCGATCSSFTRAASTRMRRAT